jgi:hypothetical protein
MKGNVGWLSSEHSLKLTNYINNLCKCFFLFSNLFENVKKQTEYVLKKEYEEK